MNDAEKTPLLNGSVFKTGDDAFQAQEAAFARRYRNATDEEVFQYVRNIAERLGRLPTKHDVPGFTYLKSRFGPWPRMLERAGMKERCRKKRRV
ncbi:hypothetical protein SAMN02745823_02815 [Sporobacter termitidis DSM 10068]|uniref:Uncharacterized protein n=2 Tax=Sporobacter TaxID=44748 RepID=A0A1M5YSX7_9FIRM|nr:hypothetical protein SAMN02745823_02815 [Sporobacter termitidis DSM 10068]